MSTLSPSRPPRRRAAIVVALAAGLSALAPLAACILADPPAELPDVPLRAPQILHLQVTPPPTTILRSWPDAFVVPVDVDPSQTVLYHEFIDYDPATHAADICGLCKLSPDPGSDDGGARQIEVTISHTGVDLDKCHTIEIMVALGFDADHTPSAPGGDSVTWFYSPTGDLTTCPVFDGGAQVADGSLPDGDGGGPLIFPQDASE